MISPAKILALSSSLLLLTACGSDGEDADSVEKGQTYQSVIRTSDVTNEACLNGGLEVEFGVDMNANGQLEEQEVYQARSHSICHGSENRNAIAEIVNTADGECEFGGKKINAGIDENNNALLNAEESSYTESICNIYSTSIRSLVEMNDEAVGLNCAAGGVVIHTGQDLNNNGDLESSEVSETQYVCNGANDGEWLDLTNLLIDTVQEVPGDNCLHGGDKHYIGIDLDSNGALEPEEISNHSYTCNPNDAPRVNFSSDGEVISGAPYSVLVTGYDDNNDLVNLTLPQFPDWLTQTRISSDRILLSGTAPELDDLSYSIQAVASDTSLETTKEMQLNLHDGSLLYVQNTSVLEGDADVKSVDVKVLLSQPLSSSIQVNYQVYSSHGSSNSSLSNSRYGQLSFLPGEIEKSITVEIEGDDAFELDESIRVSLGSVNYSGSEFFKVEEYGQLLIKNDDELTLYAEQLNTISFYGASQGSLDFQGAPEWFIPLEDRPYLYSATPSSNLVGENGSFNLKFYGNKILNSQLIQYSVVEGDRDFDGTANSLDLFPDNALGYSDSDADGIADEWEIKVFASLILANFTSDFDGNGLTDRYAFETNTPASDLSFSFEDAQLPSGWVNSGDVDWIVTQDESAHGSYALAVARPLKNGEKAKLTFSIHSQNGRWEYRSKYNVANSSGFSTKIYMDDNPRSIYTSANNWNEGSIEVSAGRHTVSIEFSSNQSPSVNEVSPIVYFDQFTGLLGVVPGDRDGDGVANGGDLFPDYSYAWSDTDEDGLGDEWEKAYYRSNLNRFYAEGDYDNDGLSDLQEFHLGTKPSSSHTDSDNVNDGNDKYPTDSRYWSDTDNDGLPDQWELEFFASINLTDGSQDSDGDSISDLQEFLLVTMPAIDTDGDGVADTLDAFAEDVRYSKDTDNDGIADEWEDFYGRQYYYTAVGDRDKDGRTDLNEFLDGTNPNEEDVRAVPDFLVLQKGQSITFNPLDNDTTGYDSISITQLSVPTSGNLVDNQNGTYTFTAANDFLGWQRLTYLSNDGHGTDLGEIYIHVQINEAPRVEQLVMANGGSHSLALLDDGLVYGWGNNDSGQLGHNEHPKQYMPMRVTGINDVKSLAVTRGSSFTLTNSGEVWYLGGRLDSPEKLTNTGTIIDMATIGYNIYLLKSDGSIVKSYAYNKPTSFTAVSGLSNITAITAGSDHLLALDTSKFVWALGRNGSGQLGYGSETWSSDTPVKVSKISNIAIIEAGGNQSFAITAEGKLYAWGANNSGQLGDGTTINRNVPVSVNTTETIVKVSAGNSHSLFLTNEGKLYGMGRNYSGELAQLTTNSFIDPIIVTNRIVIEMVAGSSRSIVSVNDGSSFGMGSNSDGALGDGTSISSRQPSQLKWIFNGALSGQIFEGFEWGEIPPYWFNQSGMWQLEESEVNTGNYAIGVKGVLTDSEEASLSAEFLTGAGDISFSVKTSSEEYDYLTFYIDGIEQASYSGIADWTGSAAFTVEAGLHKLEWIYAKDGGTSEGLDTVWLDDIQIPIDSDADGIIDTADLTPHGSAL